MKKHKLFCLVLFFLVLFCSAGLMLQTSLASEDGYWKLTDVEKINNFTDVNCEVTTFTEGCVIVHSSIPIGDGTCSFYECKFNWTPPPTILIPGQTVTLYEKITNGKVSTPFYEDWSIRGQMGQYGLGLGGGHISLGCLDIAKEDGTGYSKDQTTEAIVPGYIEPKLQISVHASGGTGETAAGYLYVYSWVKGTPPADVTSGNSQLSGKWTIHSGGVIGGGQEYNEYYKGYLVINNSGNKYTGQIYFEAINIVEELTDISFENGILKFTRPPILSRTVPQYYEASVSGETLDGSFSQPDTDASQKWWGEKTQ